MSRPRDRVSAAVREAIVEGEMRPGQLVRLGPVAEKVGVSITPVREALLQLARDGWLKQEPNRGFRVLPIRRNDVEDTFLVYGRIGGELAARAATRVTDDTVRGLELVDEEIQQLTTAGEVRDAERLNYVLHKQIYSIADSPQLVSLVSAATRFLPRMSWTRVTGWSELNVTGHGPVIEAIRARRPAEARETMTAHLESASQLLLSWLDATSFWARQR